MFKSCTLRRHLCCFRTLDVLVMYQCFFQLMYLVPLFKCNAIVFTLHLRGGVKGIIVIAPSLGFGGILLYSIYAQRASLNTTNQFTLSFLFHIVTNSSDPCMSICMPACLNPRLATRRRRLLLLDARTMSVLDAPHDILQIEERKQLNRIECERKSI